MTRVTHEKSRVEEKIAVQTYLDGLQYAIEGGSARVTFQKDRRVDKTRDKEFTNRYTISQLFPNEDEVEVLKRELLLLTVEEYIETLKDTRFPKLSEWRIFGKEYAGKDVYIKFRAELLSVIHAGGDSYILVMSFHFAEKTFLDSDFPYGKK